RLHHPPRGHPGLPLLEGPAEPRMRTRQSDYMHWAKTQTPARYNLASSEVPHFPLDRFPIDIADLHLTGASHYRYPPLREAIARKCGVDPACVVMADGTSMANMLAMAALIDPGAWGASTRGSEPPKHTPTSGSRVSPSGGLTSSRPRPRPCSPALGHSPMHSLSAARTSGSRPWSTT